MPKAKPRRGAPGIFGRDLKVVNIGIPTFADDLSAQGVTVVKVDWKPPAGGDSEMMRLLDKLGT
ncbi:MAG TPA: hypothetical protein VLX56_03610 [Nitrososphaerales archaeon]|nr:hypothetical protein [Nitrososphaerales archaeon]